MNDAPRGIERGRDGFFHPTSVEEVQKLTALANERGVPLRVRGAGHSPKRAIHGDRYTGRGTPPSDSIEVVLEQMDQVTFVEEHDDHAIVEVQAGCHLGRDPYDITKTSTWARSLNHQLDQKGWAINSLGGISHQTVSGFLLTGSSGGSVINSAGENIVGLQIVDGKGEVHEIGEGDEMFDAAGVSMGLLGVVTKVRLRVGPRYDIAGHEQTVEMADFPYDLFGEGDKPSFVDHMKKQPYSRVLWWPQNDVNRLQLWEARRLGPDEPYEHQPFKILTPTDAALGSLMMNLIGHIDDLDGLRAALREIRWYERFRQAVDAPVEEDVNAYANPPCGPANQDHVMRDVEQCLARALEGGGGTAYTEPGPLSIFSAKLLTKFVRALVEGKVSSVVADKLIGPLLRWRLPSLIDEVVKNFIVVDDKKFQDSWFVGLPMDNQMDDRLWGTSFTEMWMPIDEAPEVLRRARDYFGTGDLKERYGKTGPFSLEFYPGPSSRFWMSPGYDQVSIRFNPFWFDSWPGRPVERFAPYWEMFKDLGFRNHWGKYLPPASDAWRAHYRRVLPRFEDFLALRAELDPKQIFVSTYWREHLGIAKP